MVKLLVGNDRHYGTKPWTEILTSSPVAEGYTVMQCTSRCKGLGSSSFEPIRAVTFTDAILCIRRFTILYIKYGKRNQKRSTWGEWPLPFYWLEWGVAKATGINGRPCVFGEKFQKTASWPFDYGLDFSLSHFPAFSCRKKLMFFHLLYRKPPHLCICLNVYMIH